MWLQKVNCLLINNIKYYDFFGEFFVFFHQKKTKQKQLFFQSVGRPFHKPGADSVLRQMATTRGKTFDWDCTKPFHGRAWEIANKHEKIMAKIRPPSPLRPRGPTFTVNDLQKQDTDSKMRCFNGPQMIELLRSAYKDNRPNSPTSVLRSSSKNVLSNVGSSLGMEQTVKPATLRRKEILNMQRKEDEEMRQEGMRKVMAARKARQDRQFEEAYAKLKEERENFIERRSDDQL